MATCGRAAGAVDVQDSFKEVISTRALPIDLKSTGCIGLCSQEVIIEIRVSGRSRLIYGNVTPDSVPSILDLTIKQGQILKEHAIYQEEPGSDSIVPYEDVPFEKDYALAGNQIKIALKNCGYIDPFKIDDYIESEGYSALKKILKMDPEVIRKANQALYEIAK
jgi:(2Fe-2S) ferredoxin